MANGMEPEEPFGLAVLADKKAEEWIAKQSKARQKQTQAAMAQLRRHLGLSAGQSLAEYMGLFEPGTRGELLETAEDNSTDDAIEDFFVRLERAYLDGDAWEQHFPTTRHP